MDEIRLAWVRRRMTISGKSSGAGYTNGNDGVIEVFREIYGGVSNFTLEDLSRSVSDLALNLDNYRELDGYGVTEPNYNGKANKRVVCIADLVDNWMLGL